MANIINGPVKVTQISELLDGDGAGNNNFIHQAGVGLPTLKNTINTLTASEYTLVKDLLYQVVADMASLPAVGNPSLIYYTVAENTYYYWNGVVYKS